MILVDSKVVIFHQNWVFKETKHTISMWKPKLLMIFGQNTSLSCSKNFMILLFFLFHFCVFFFSEKCLFRITKKRGFWFSGYVATFTRSWSVCVSCMHTDLSIQFERENSVPHIENWFFSLVRSCFSLFFSIYVFSSQRIFKPSRA